MNRNSTSEYASMVLGVVLPYDLARAQGMKAISAAEGEMARRWQRRVLYGDWTHAGLMNWDTGHGFLRWQLRRYWALAGNGLLAIASSRRLAFGATARNQAKYVFDQSLRQYDRLAVTEGPLLGSTFYAIKNAASQPRLDPALTAARFASLATRAAVLGLGTMEAAPLPPAYGYDPDIRRLAVTTPSYSTAITQATRRRQRRRRAVTAARRQGRAAVGHRAATAPRRPPSASGWRPARARSSRPSPGSRATRRRWDA